MNGQTTIDPINPCSAEADRHTYGCKWLHVSTWGRRLIRVGIAGVTIDLFWVGWCRPVYGRMRNAAVLFLPVGSVAWPMPDRIKKGGDS